MPSVYAPVKGCAEEPYSTFYQVFVQRRKKWNERFMLVFHRAPPDDPAAKTRQVFRSGGSAFVAVGDGPSQTLLVVEAGKAVPWTKPEDLTYSPTEPLPELGGETGNGFVAAFADGHVGTIRQGLSDAKVRALITARGDDDTWK
jgi:prepilin-type processing-associated H-X9-DG protein